MQLSLLDDGRDVRCKEITFHTDSAAFLVRIDNRYRIRPLCLRARFVARDIGNYDFRLPFPDAGAIDETVKRFALAA